jgi:hypothetical protein
MELPRDLVSFFLNESLFISSLSLSLFVCKSVLLKLTGDIDVLEAITELELK